MSVSHMKYVVSCSAISYFVIITKFGDFVFTCLPFDFGRDDCALLSIVNGDNAYAFVDYLVHKQYSYQIKSYKSQVPIFNQH